MGELRQYHPSLKVSQIKELPKGDYLVIRDSVQDVVILQSETKMKAKYQIKSSAIKGVPTDRYYGQRVSRIP